MAPEFVPGLQLARGFYAAVVRPLLAEQFPEVPYAAALLGPGSEVAGFDSTRSTDHDWGSRLQIFLADGDADGHARALTAMLASRPRHHGLVSPRRVAVPAGLPVAAYRAGGSLSRPVRGGR